MARIAVVALAAWLGTMPAYGATKTVNAAGGAQYTTIKAAMSAASAGDTIQVAAGTYRECIDFGGKKMILNGAGISTLLDCQGKAAAAITLTKAEPSGTEVNNIMVKNAGKQAVSMSNATLTAQGLYIQNSGNASISGGAIGISGGSLTLRYSTLTANTGWNGGHVYMTNKAKVTVSDTTISFGTAANGGAIYATSGTTLSMTTVAIDSNKASGNGGAVYATGAIVTSDHCSWSGNTAKAAGAVRVDAQATFSSTRDQYLSNSATSDGGAVFAYDRVTMSVREGYLWANRSGGQGGAIVASKVKSMLLDSSTFESNIAGNNGGAVYVIGTATTGPVIRSCDFLKNSSTSGMGGAIFSNVSTDFSVSDSQFEDNKARLGGGAIRVDNRGVTSMYRNYLVRNSASNGPGGGLNAGGTPTDVLDIQGGSFESNSATHGGAMLASTYLGVSMADVTFTYNSTTGGGTSKGGALYLLSNKSVTGAYTDFRSNSGGTGGAIYSEATASETWSRSLFIDNNSVGPGGGVYLNNSAAALLINNTYAHNDAATGSGDGVYAAGGKVTGKNLIFYQHDLALLTTGSATLTYSDWFANTTNAAGAGSLGTTNLYVDPKFELFDFWLAFGSPLKAAGDPSIFNDDGSRSDVGARGTFPGLED